jgi:hypothetical protein
VSEPRWPPKRTAESTARVAETAAAELQMLKEQAARAARIKIVPPVAFRPYDGIPNSIVISVSIANEGTLDSDRVHLNVLVR